MKREFRDKWVEALRSGKFEQTQGVLCTAEGARCCLGVAYEVDDHDYKTKVEPTFQGNTIRKVIKFWDEDGVGKTIMPSSYAYRSWGLDYTDAVTLSQMNDNGKSFLEIADWIEENILVVD